MDRIIDFNEIKNKANEKDIDKFEGYIYELYYSFSQGKITMAQLNKDVLDYMEKNNISQEKFFNIQKELMKRYGVNMDDIQNNMQNMGIDTSMLNIKEDYEKVRKTLSFQEKYHGKVTIKPFSTYSIKNSHNDLEIMLNEENVIIKSIKNINLSDSELNEFLCSYKKVVDGKNLKVSLFENVKEYEY